MLGASKVGVICHVRPIFRNSQWDISIHQHLVQSWPAFNQLGSNRPTFLRAIRQLKARSRQDKPEPPPLDSELNAVN